MGLNLNCLRLIAWILCLALPSGCGKPPASSSSESGTQELGSASAQVAMQSVIKERAVRLDPRKHGIGMQVPDLSFSDLEGRTGKLSDYAERRGLVLVIRDVGCPVGARIGPASARLEAECLKLDVPFLYVNLSSHDTPEEMREEVASFGFQGRYVLDPEARFGRALGATTSTDFFLLDARRTLIYRGAADDQSGRGATLEAAEHHYLRDALAAMLAGTRPEIEASLAPGYRLDLEGLEVASEANLPTYHAEVSRIIQRNCVSCHREGGAGPFRLDSYRQLKGRKSMLRFMLAEKLMPPWLASAHSGPFVGDRRMSEEELQTLDAWYDNGMPLGDEAQAPLPLQWHGEWVIGQPDHVFEDTEPFMVPAEGVVDLVSTYMDVELPEDIWVDRIQISASAPKVVHHSSVLLRFPKQHANASQAGLRKSADGHDWRFFMAYLPGAGSRIYPAGVGRMIPKGSVLRVVTHYTTTGLPTPNRMRIGVVEAKSAPRFVVETRMLRRHDIVILPGAADVHFDQKFRVPKDVLLYSVTPHMHLRGKRFLAHTQVPGEKRRELIEIPQWDSDWQFSFVLAEPRFLPADSSIEYEVWYDNSAANPANPDPTQTVRDGPQIWDEMMQFWLEWIRPRVPGE